MRSLFALSLGGLDFRDMSFVAQIESSCSFCSRIRSTRGLLHHRRLCFGKCYYAEKDLCRSKRRGVAELIKKDLHCSKRICTTRRYEVLGCQGSHQFPLDHDCHTFAIIEFAYAKQRVVISAGAPKRKGVLAVFFQGICTTKR
jgi:hypothetical protein